MTPLAAIIAETIAVEGPMPIDRFMGLALGHSRYGYYMSRDPLGAEGDFITAPETSQVFGELIGVWCVAVWQSMLSPRAFNLVELGPGRGTLMSDILRAGRVAPGFVEAAQVHLVETSPVLRDAQRQRLGDRPHWHDSLASVPEGPLIVVANEFFDALPVRQFEWRRQAWFERAIGLEAGRLTIGLVPGTFRPAGDHREFDEGAIVEVSPQRSAVAEGLGRRLSRHMGAALIIDYGHLQPAPGDTLQAVRGHRFVAITDRPGESDVTAHVDFAALSLALCQGGARVRPALTQRDFLMAMGFEQRSARLLAAADAAQRPALERSFARLADRQQMGNLFKVVAATSPGLPAPYPFGE